MWLRSGQIRMAMSWNPNGYGSTIGGLPVNYGDIQPDHHVPAAQLVPAFLRRERLHTE